MLTHLVLSAISRTFTLSTKVQILQIQTQDIAKKICATFYTFTLDNTYHRIGSKPDKSNTYKWINSSVSKNKSNCIFLDLSGKLLPHYMVFKGCHGCHVLPSWHICKAKLTIRISQDKREKQSLRKDIWEQGGKSSELGKNKRSLIPDFRSTCSAVVDFVARQLLPEERANELPRTMERSQQAEQPGQDRKDNSERLLLFVSTDNGAVMTGNIQTMQWERVFHAARK